MPVEFDFFKIEGFLVLNINSFHVPHTHQFPLHFLLPAKCSRESNRDFANAFVIPLQKHSGV